MSSIFTDNLVALYSTPSYYHKTFENKFHWKNLVEKNVFWIVEFLKKLRRSFSLLSTSNYSYIYMKSPPMVYK